jgi:hypothetical protein
MDIRARLRIVSLSALLVALVTAGAALAGSGGDTLPPQPDPATACDTAGTVVDPATLPAETVDPTQTDPADTETDGDAQGEDGDSQGEDESCDDPATEDTQGEDTQDGTSSEDQQTDSGDQTQATDATTQAEATPTDAEREAECLKAAGIDPNAPPEPTDPSIKLTGLDNAIEHVLANCVKNIDAPGLVIALQQLVINRDLHLAHDEAKAAAKAARDAARAARKAEHAASKVEHGNGNAATHGASGAEHGNAGAEHGNAGTHGNPHAGS